MSGPLLGAKNAKNSKLGAGDHIIFSIEAENAFGTSQYPFTMKILSKKIDKSDNTKISNCKP